MAECPTCDRDDFKSEHGVKLHHARTHGESLVTSVRECEWCGSDVEVHDTRRGQNERVFCSDSDCYAEWQSKNKTGENSPTFNGGKVTVECLVCGEEKEVYPYRIDQFDVFYCSTECESKHRSQQTGPDANNWKGGKATLTCEECGDSYEVKPYREENSRFCSNKCHNSWKLGNPEISGENAHAWDGGPAKYGKGWTEEKKTRVRERDNHTCQHPGCTITTDEHKETVGVNLHVHHIQPAAQFESDEKKNNMENLITLCLPHHRLWEQMAPLKPTNAG